MIGQAGDSAETRCRQRRPEFYSVSLHHLCIKTSIAKRHWNNLKHKKPERSDALQQRFDRAEISLVLHDEMEAAHQTYKECNQHLQAASNESYDLREQELRS